MSPRNAVRTFRVMVAMLATLLCEDRPLAVGPAASDCDCQREAEHSVTCHQSIWPRYGGAKPATLDELETLLDTMWEGSEEDLEQLRGAGCLDEQDTEACVDECMEATWEAYYFLINSAPTPAIRWGAITLAFGAYMDIGAPEAVRLRLGQVAKQLLEDNSDVTTAAAVLRMMKFYRLGSQDVLELLLRHMSDADALVRQLSHDRFAQYTRSNLAFDAQAKPRKREKQIQRMRRWLHEQKNSLPIDAQSGDT